MTRAKALELERQADRTEPRPLERLRRIALDRRQLARLERHRARDVVMRVVGARHPHLASASLRRGRGQRPVTAPRSPGGAAPTSRSRAARIGLAEVDHDGVVLREHEHVLALVAVGGERAGLVRPQPPVAAVVAPVLGVVGDRRCGRGRPIRRAARARRRPRRRAGTARRSGRTGGPARGRRTRRPSCRPRRSGARRRASRSARTGAGRGTPASPPPVPPAARRGRRSRRRRATRLMMFVVPDE